MHDSAPPAKLDYTLTPGFARRLAAMLYDWLLLFALMLVATSLITLPLGMPGGIGLVLFQSLIFLFIPAVFFIGFWLRGGQTLGMRSWRIRLVTDSGQPVDGLTALRRLLAALLSLLPCGLGFIWILFDPEGLAWHDRLSRTRLVMVEPGNPG
jgi:uncharacterized RDD family membrane protein YckC